MSRNATARAVVAVSARPAVLSLVVALGAANLSSAPVAASVESELQAALTGRSALSRGALVSECTDHFTNMKVVGGRLAGGTGSGFSSGELVTIDKVSIGLMSGLDVNLTIVEPFLLSWEDGPYTVYDKRRCRVQLNFEVGRDVRRDRAKAQAAIEAVLATFAGEAQAKASPEWNERRVKPYPKDWEQTKVAYEKYRMAKRNEAVRQKTEEVLALAAQTLRYMDSDDDYLISFAAGARAHSESWSDCDAMLRASFISSGNQSKDYEGWADGQRVAWANQLAEELQDCYIDVK
jgi:hypothetical protein